MTISTKRNLMIPDALWEAAIQSALRESVERGHYVSVSEWIRDAMLKKLGREECAAQTTPRR